MSSVFFKDFARSKEGKVILEESLETARNSLKTAQENLSELQSERPAFGDRAERYLLLQAARSHLNNLEHSIKALSSALSATQASNAAPTGASHAAAAAPAPAPTKK